MIKQDWIIIKEALQEKLIAGTDEAKDAEVAIVLSKVEAQLIAHELKGVCKVCKEPFKAIDVKTFHGRPKGVCTACFTSNA